MIKIPVNVVHTKHQEKMWNQAKESARREGKAKNYAYIMSTFERMNHHVGGKKGKDAYRTSKSEKLLALQNKRASDMSQDRDEEIASVRRAFKNDDAGLIKMRKMLKLGTPINPRYVYRYLAQNYPPDVLKWVMKAQWFYEPRVSLERIMVDRRPGGRDPNRVDELSSMIEDGAYMEPVILVHVQNQPRLRIADGFHRCLAFKNVGTDYTHAFIAYVHNDGKWSQRLRRVHEAKLNKASMNYF